MIPTTFLCTTLFYLAYGPRVVLLLDHRLFNPEIALSTFWCKQIFSIIVLWHVALALVPFLEKTPETFRLMCVCATNTHHYLLCGILLYSQLATARRLAYIQRLLTFKNCTNFIACEKLAVYQFKDLAVLNEQLNELTSFSLLIFFFTNIYKIIIFSVQFGWLASVLHRAFIRWPFFWW